MPTPLIALSSILANQVELLKNCLQTVFNRIGGSDDTTSTQSMLKALADIFILNKEIGADVCWSFASAALHLTHAHLA